MGKRKSAAPIVPAGEAPSGSQLRKKKKAAKKSDPFGWVDQAALEGTPSDPAAAGVEELPSAAVEGGGFDRLITVEMAEASDLDGAELASQPDRSDKPERFLDWMLAPMGAERFLAECFEQQPVHIRRADRTYNAGWFTSAELDRQLRECSLRWTDEIDCARYQDGKRQTLNGDDGSVADLATVRARFDEGCSVRLSWPQRHSDPVWAMLALLEERFGCGAGANVYHTPAGCQGFAPHWDDINAFVLQLEGEKSWRLYAPRSEAEVLPRFSSPNLAQEELGDLIAQVTLRPGDLLYLPRGLVHQAVSTEAASLHLTVSTGRQHSWRELVELGLQGAIEAASLGRREWREQLPPDLPATMGVIHSETDSERRVAIASRIRGMLTQLVEELPIDALCDQFLCQRFMYERLPPRLTRREESRRGIDPEEVTIESRVRLVSWHAAQSSCHQSSGHQSSCHLLPLRSAVTPLASPSRMGSSRSTLARTTRESTASTQSRSGLTLRSSPPPLSRLYLTPIQSSSRSIGCLLTTMHSASTLRRHSWRRALCWCGSRQRRPTRDGDARAAVAGGGAPPREGGVPETWPTASHDGATAVM